MSGRRAFLGGAPALLATLAGCAGPRTDYYRLAALPGPVLTGGPGQVGVRGVFVPGYLDQTNIVKPSGAYQFDTYANELWAEPLAEMLQGVMVQDLGARLAGTTVLGSNGAIGVQAPVLVEINVIGFDPNAAGQITLNAQIAIRAGADNSLWLAGGFLKTAGAGPAVADLVATMSSLWAAAADLTATMIVRSWAAHQA